MASTYMTIIMKLPETILDDLSRVIEDEVKIASKKWRVKLTPEEQARVIENAYTQTRLKTSAIAKIDWDLGKKLAIRVPFHKNASLELGGNKELKKKEYFLTLTKDGWIIADDEVESPVSTKDLLKTQIEQIYTWARTAVFYGVGSYAR